MAEEQYSLMMSKYTTQLDAQIRQFAELTVEHIKHLLSRYNWLLKRASKLKLVCSAQSMRLERHISAKLAERLDEARQAHKTVSERL